MLRQQTLINSSRWNKNLALIHLHHVSLASVNEAQCVRLIADELEAGHGGWCVTVNLEILRQTATHQELRQLIEGSNLRVADGITLVWASWLQGTPLPERVCGSNLIYSLTREVSHRGKAVFLLGGNPGTAKKAADILKQENPGIRIAGTWCPPLNFEQDPAQVQEIKTIIYTAKPDIVYVALGFPKSEQLISKIRYICPNAWWIGVGISFSYVIGDIKRPPRWAQNVGLETLYRLVQEPRRLAKRYLKDGPIFATQLFSRALIQRFMPDK